MATGALRADPGDALSRAKVWLVLNQPFFSRVVLDIPYVAETGGVKTLSTDGRSIYYNPDFAAGLPVRELAGAICHEIMHNLLLHLPRRRGRVAQLWNLAADIAVNNDLVDAGLRLPEGSVIYKPFSRMSAEEIYAALVREHEGAGGPTGEGRDRGTGDEDVSSLLRRYGASEETLSKSHGLWDAAPDIGRGEDAGDDAWLDRLFRGISAAETGRGTGSVPRGIRRMVKELTSPRLSWKTRLAQSLGEHLRPEEFNPSRPNLKYLSGSLHLPSLRSLSAHLVVAALDTSASVSGELLEEFAGELFGLLEEVEEVETLAFDTEVHPLGRFLGGEDPGQLLSKLELTGGGGTDFGPVFNFVDEQGLNPAAVVVFTDLRGRFPEEPPVWPTIWVTPDTDHEGPPFGEVVSMSADIR